MIEIFSLYAQLLIFIIIFQFPLNSFILNKYSVITFNYFEVLVLNIVIQLFFYLIISFTAINLKSYFIFQIFLGFIFLIFNIINYYKKKKLLFEDDLILLIFFLILNIIFFTYIALNLRIEWDGLAHWLHKAQIFFQGGTFSDIKNVPFSYYPHLGTFLWGFFWKNSILQLEYFGRLIVPFLYLSGIFFCVSSFKKEKVLITKILIILLTLTLTLDYYLFGGYQDYFLFFLLLIFSKFFYLYQKNNSTILFIILFLNLVLIQWTKQEGFFYNIILTTIFVFFSNKNNKTKLLFTLLVLLSLIFQIYLKNIFIGSFEFNEKILHEGLIRYTQISEILSTFILISKHIFISIFRYPIWILIIFILIFSLTELKIKLFDFSLLYLFLFTMFVYAIYFQTTMNLDFLLPITLDRILLQGSGFMVYPISIYLCELIKKFKV